MSRLPTRTKLKLDMLIDGAALREDLTALTTGTGGDGSPLEVRATVLALLKQVRDAGHKTCERWLLEDGSGLACAQRLAHLQDTIISALYDFAVTHVMRLTNLSEGERMAILAVGGYGRGTLAPGSDLDLLFLLPYKQTASGEDVIEYMLYMLWDMGEKVGHATRTVDECIRLSKEDMTIRTAILEARPLHGNSALSEDLAARFDTEIVSVSASEFIASKLKERDARHDRAGQSRYRVEPNVKEGKGGQRDLHTLFWIAKYFYRVGSQAELVDVGVLSKAEFRTFVRAQDFLWAVRCHMHFVTGRATEQMSFDLQPTLAERLGYTDHPGLSAVERFMKHYFLVAKDVGDLTRILCSALEEEDAAQPKGVTGNLTGLFRNLTNRPKRIAGSTQFVQSHNRITPVDEDVFKRDPAQMIEMFRLAERDGMLFHPDAMQMAARSLKLIRKNVREDPAANASFLEILTSPKTPERTLRKMNEAGVLGRFIPEFGRIVAMMQFNMYHHFTVDEHLLRSIGVMSRIENGLLTRELPLVSDLFAPADSVPETQRQVLYVALFLHDIAKGRPEDHSTAGAKIARKLCPRFGLTAAQTDIVAWLVEMHLVMSTTAQSRDLSDPRTIADFSVQMRTLERMRLLLVLTVCDITAVGPGVWNGWKGQLLRTLFYETEPLLTGGFTRLPRHQQVAQVKADVADKLSDWFEAERQAALDLPYDNYWLTVPRDAQLHHLRFIRDCDRTGKTFATDTYLRPSAAITEITLLAPDHPRLLSTVTGCCAAAGANIVDASIFTLRDGRAFNSMVLNRTFESDDDEMRRADRIADMIEDVLSGEKRLSDLMAAHLASRGPVRKRTQVFKVPPRVDIDNGLSDDLTVIEIEARDRPGLLSDVTNALADLSLDVQSAHIATFGEKAHDTFYVRDFARSKIVTPQKLAAVRKRISAALQPPEAAAQTTDKAA